MFHHQLSGHIHAQPIHRQTIYWTNNPPSTAMTLLVTYPVFTIHTTVSAISPGVPKRPIGISTTKGQSSASTQGIDLLLASVSFVPGNMAVSAISAGATAFTVIPFFAYVDASQWTRP